MPSTQPVVFVDRLFILAPALILAGYMIGAFFVYLALCAMGRTPQVSGLERTNSTEIIGPLLQRYFYWFLRPIERVVVARRISPNAVTYASLLLAACAGVAIALGHMATAAWLYIFAGALDVLDGRLARATGQASRKGAFLDSVADRWGELFVFSGFAWFLRDSFWLLAVMLAVSGSIMVSYTRARGEGVGLKLDGGTMQRPERIFLVAVGTLLTAWFDSGTDTEEYGVYVIGIALLIVGVASSVTAIGRWHKGYRTLEAQDAVAAGDDHPVSEDEPEATSTSAPTATPTTTPPPQKSRRRPFLHRSDHSHGTSTS